MFVHFGQLSMVPSILNHVVRTKNLADLEYFWREWRSVLADRDRAKSAFISYVRLLRLAAYYNGEFSQYSHIGWNKCLALISWKSARLTDIL